ncbi:MAG: TIGR02757 family protein [Candidatus Eisenbacteria bacterium]|nr:TIGR02757 family protein [Candidatus Eisenbacteria bacterium]
MTLTVPPSDSRTGTVTPPLPEESHLREHLESLYRTFDLQWISPDPLEVVRRYEDPADQEVVGFLAAGLAYGRVDQILKSLNRLLDRMGPSPARFVHEFEWSRDAGRFRGWYHRFHGPRDVALLCLLLSRALRGYGTLEALFIAGDDSSTPDIGGGLAAFCERVLDAADLPPGPGVSRGRLGPRSPVRFFFASPADGSAVKRLNLWLRWMVRGGDGLDLGVWTSVDRARLVIPLDTHVARIARYIGLTRRITADWKTALEITDRLRHLDPADPVKYDFAICRLGILDHCPRRRDPICCAACLLRPVCLL